MLYENVNYYYYYYQRGSVDASTLKMKAPNPFEIPVPIYKTARLSHPTKRHSELNGRALDLHWGCDGFKSRLGHRIS
jgi:hypothetical protein